MYSMQFIRIHVLSQLFLWGIVDLNTKKCRRHSYHAASLDDVDLSVSLFGCRLLSIIAMGRRFFFGLQHVLLISPDGMHAEDLSYFIAAYPDSNFANMANSGIRYLSLQCFTTPHCSSKQPCCPFVMASCEVVSTSICKRGSHGSSEATRVKYAATYLYINDVYVVRPKLPL